MRSASAGWHLRVLAAHPPGVSFHIAQSLCACGAPRHGDPDWVPSLPACSFMCTCRSSVSDPNHSHAPYTLGLCGQGACHRAVPSAGVSICIAQGASAGRRDAAQYPVLSTGHRFSPGGGEGLGALWGHTGTRLRSCGPFIRLHCTTYKRCTVQLYTTCTWYEATG